jgi:putative toxin-antitoxin system antitoxin component (TIGR02293 family)
VADLLGGDTILGRSFLTVLDAHEFIQRGLPSKSLISLLGQMPSIAREIDSVVGISTRTLQRHKKDGAKELLSREQSGRLYRVAEIAAKAIDVLGSSEDAQRFLEEPALALDGNRPIDLLSTPAGAELVQRHLTRLDYGVYT